MPVDKKKKTLGQQVGNLNKNPIIQEPLHYAKELYKMSKNPDYTMSGKSYPVTSDILSNSAPLRELTQVPKFYTTVIDNKTGEKFNYPAYGSGEIPEMSFGGILADVGAGAAGGALTGAAGGAGVASWLTAPVGAILGGAAGLFKGLKGHFAEKKAERLEEKRLSSAHTAEAVGMQNYQQMYNPFAKTMTAGGEAGANVELEKEEVFQTPSGQIGQVDAPSHEAGGVKMNLEPGTRVWSDKLKATSGLTFAEEAEKIKKQIAKYEKKLN